MIEARPGGSREPLALAAPLFVAAGVGAVVVQTLWLRELRLALGGTSAALAATLAALAHGQACGARLGERVAGSATNPLRAIGALALAGALGALATPDSISARGNQEDNSVRYILRLDAIALTHHRARRAPRRYPEVG